MISVEHLTKYYGEHLAVNDLSFEIDEWQFTHKKSNNNHDSTVKNIS